MTHETCLWLNRASIVFGYFAFWFVAPEFIGEVRLISWQLHAKRLVGLMIASWASVVSAMEMSFQFPAVIQSIRTSHSFWYGLRHAPQNLPRTQTIILLCAFGVGVALKIWGQKLLTLLANQSKWRSISFAFGALLFTISCALQVASTIEKK